MTIARPRAVVGVLLAALLVPFAGATPAAAQVDQRGAAETAAGWLARELDRDDGRLSGPVSGTDWGLTIDAIYALAASGVGAVAAERATDNLEANVLHYIGAPDRPDLPDFRFSGGLAKTALAAQIMGRDPTAFGGYDLIADLQGLLLDDQTPDVNGRVYPGRYAMINSLGGSNMFGQSLSLLALARTDDGVPQVAIDYVLAHECDGGGYALWLREVAVGCSDQEPHVDATAMVVQALLAVDTAATRAAAQDAARWLVEVQQDPATGGFADPPFTGVNTNSTGLAVQAVRAAGFGAAANRGAAFIQRHQVGCDQLPAIRGAIAWVDASIGRELTRAMRDQFRRATAQAIFALGLPPLGELTIDGTRGVEPHYPCTPDRFPDVDYAGSPHGDAILALTERSVFIGSTTGEFRPASRVTRGQLASLIARAMQLEMVPAGRPTFSDVPRDYPHLDAIEMLAEEGIIAGYPDGTFRPQQSIDRGQIAALLGRWLELDPVDRNAFRDLGNTVHAGWVNALHDAGIALGSTDGTYRPREDLRRDQMASLLWRALQWQESSR